jgi:hypothetical protein
MEPTYSLPWVFVITKATVAVEPGTRLDVDGALYAIESWTTVTLWLVPTVPEPEPEPVLVK